MEISFPRTTDGHNSINIKSPEIERLLNPIYCACLLSKFTNAYNSANQRKLVYFLAFLCLPMTLYPLTKNEIISHNRNFGLHRLIHDKPEILIRLPQRVEGFSTITKEAILFGVNYNLLNLELQTATITTDDKFVRQVDKFFSRDLEAQTLKASELLGYWFAQLDVADILLYLGIRF